MRTGPTTVAAASAAAFFRGNSKPKLAENESGATAIEYAMIAMLISLAIVAGARQIGQETKKPFENIVANGFK